MLPHGMDGNRPPDGPAKGTMDMKLGTKLVVAVLLLIAAAGAVLGTVTYASSRQELEKSSFAQMGQDAGQKAVRLLSTPDGSRKIFCSRLRILPHGGTILARLTAAVGDLYLVNQDGYFLKHPDKCMAKP